MGVFEEELNVVDGRLLFRVNINVKIFKWFLYFCRREIIY